VTKWAKVGVWGAGIAGVIVIVGVIAGGVAFLGIRGHRTVTDYAIDMPSAPFGGGWSCFGCRPPGGLDPTNLAAGVPASPPSGAVFRGVVVTSDAFPDALGDARIVKDGYYLEFKDGTARFVADDAPWAAVVPQLRMWADPEWTGYLATAGVIDPA
jgi:hypothetical protein